MAEKAPEVGEVTAWCNAVVLKLQLSGLLGLCLVSKLPQLILCSDCAFNQKKLLNWTSCSDQKGGRLWQGRYVSFWVVSELSLFAQWLGVNYSGLLGAACLLTQDEPFHTPPLLSLLHRGTMTVWVIAISVREFSAEAWC